VAAVRTPVLLGVDVGTSSTKALLVDPAGYIHERRERPHRMSMPQPGWAEHDAEAVWWADSLALIRELAALPKYDVRGVGCSGIGPCLLPVTSSGAPLRPAILYGIDTRAAAEIDELTDRFGGAQILQRGGSSLSSQALGPKFLWLQHHEPAIWRQTRRFFMASSYLVYRLTGAYVLDHQSASQCDPMYDIEEFGWARDWAEEIAPGLELPTLLWSDEVAGTVTADAASLTGLPPGVPVVAGTIDAWAEAMSIGIRRPGDTMLMYGTTMFLVEAAADVTPDGTIWVTAGVQRGTRTLAAGMSTSGAVTAWFHDLVGASSFGELFEAAAAVPPGAGGLVTLPYFGGERTPVFDPDARGVIAGLTLSHSKGHVFRSLLEATGFGLRHIFEALDHIAPMRRRLVAVGGGAQSAVWPQIVSDITGEPQELPEQTIGASYGDALLAAIGAGLVEPTTSWARQQTLISPQPATRALYDESYAVYRELYPATATQVHRLAALQRGISG
jgi:xylulokinase